MLNNPGHQPPRPSGAEIPAPPPPPPSIELRARDRAIVLAIVTQFATRRMDPRMPAAEWTRALLENVEAANLLLIAKQRVLLADEILAGVAEGVERWAARTGVILLHAPSSDVAQASAAPASSQANRSTMDIQRPRRDSSYSNFSHSSSLTEPAAVNETSRQSGPSSVPISTAATKPSWWRVFSTVKSTSAGGSSFSKNLPSSSFRSVATTLSKYLIFRALPWMALGSAVYLLVSFLARAAGNS